MYHHTYHSDLRQEIAFLQAQLDYKRRKLADCLRDKTPFAELEKLYDEIREVETKMQICFEEAKAQSEEDRREG